jgi:hypothetical protein
MEQVYGVVTVALVMGLVELVKKEIPATQKYAGLMSLGVGIALGFAYGLKQGWDPLQCLVVGASVGLSASGLYSGVKNASEAMK